MFLPSADDRDGDGQSNGTEDALGTNPFDGSSFMTLSVSRTAGGQSQVEFPGVAGHGYEIQYSPDLSTAWIRIASVDPVIDGMISFTDTNATRNAQPKGFYRIAAP